MNNTKRRVAQLIAASKQARWRSQMEQHHKPKPVSPVISAEWPGKCERCAQPIVAGETIVRARFWDGFEAWVHLACAARPGDPVEPPPRTDPVTTPPPPDVKPHPLRLLADGRVGLWTASGREQIISRSHPHYDFFHDKAERAGGEMSG